MTDYIRSTLWVNECFLVSTTRETGAVTIHLRQYNRRQSNYPSVISRCVFHSLLYVYVNNVCHNKSYYYYFVEADGGMRLFFFFFVEGDEEWGFPFFSSLLRLMRNEPFVFFFVVQADLGMSLFFFFFVEAWGFFSSSLLRQMRNKAVLLLLCWGGWGMRLSSLLRQVRNAAFFFFFLCWDRLKNEAFSRFLLLCWGRVNNESYF